MRLLRPAAGAGKGWAGSLLELGLGVGFGIGLSSMLFFVLTVTGTATAATILLTDIALMAALAAIWFYLRERRRGAAVPVPAASLVQPAFRYDNWILAALLISAVVIVLDGMRNQAAADPHGMWDAWAIWNVRARFLAGPGETWRNAISPLLERTHPDYPLLLSGFVARCWKLAGSYDTVVPIATALAFFLATLAVLVAALALLRSASTGLLAGLTVMTGFTYLSQPMSQYSDVPLAYYYLAAVALASLSWKAEERRRPLLLVLAGYAAGCAAWTKNEGLLFAAVFGCCYAAADWWFSGFGKALRRSLWLGAGMLPGLILVAWLKLLAPVADPLVRAGKKGIAQGATQSWRRQFVWRAIARNAGEFGYTPATHPLVALAVLAAILRFSLPRALRPAAVCGAASVGLVFGGYVVVSLGAFTPFDRFFSQLFPLFLLVFFLALRPLEELLKPAAAALATAPDAPRKRSKKKRSSRA
ncbi:MAG: hypothetical protein K6T61_11400 [Bryobacteraceae bacterium]|nr:hypothetical protein [Bryobacteraceae bacterium]